MSDKEKTIMARTNTLVVCFITYFLILVPLLIGFIFTKNDIVMYVSLTLIILMFLANILFMVDTRRYNSWWHIILSWVVVLPVFPFVICVAKILNWCTKRMNKRI